MGSSTSFSGKVISISEWKVVAILSSIATMVMYAETMLVPAIPDLIKDFNIPYSIPQEVKEDLNGKVFLVKEINIKIIDEKALYHYENVVLNVS